MNTISMTKNHPSTLNNEEGKNQVERFEVSSRYIIYPNIFVKGKSIITAVTSLTISMLPYCSLPYLLYLPFYMY